MIEDEVKFSFPEGVALPSFDDAKLGLTAAPEPPAVLRSVYYDSDDLRLVAAGITLRRRTRAGASSWDLKVPLLPGDIGRRNEISVADRSTTPPDALTNALLGWTGGDSLGVVATLRSRRTTWTVTDREGNAVAEVVDDEVERLEGRKVLARFREVEIERRGVSESYIERVARKLAKAGATPSAATKLSRVLDMPAVAPLPEVRKGAPVAALLTAALRKAADGFLAADVGVRLGEPDSIHQLRVSCRRMRSDLRAYGAVLDAEWRDHLDGELRWIGRALGTARDAEVIAERVTRDAADLGAAGERVVADVVTRRARAADEAEEALRDPRYLALARLVRTLDPPLAGSGGAPAKQVVAEVLDAAWRDVERSVRRLSRRGDTDAAWHAVRINAKRARYASETAASVSGGAATALAKAAEAIQDVLGEFHDATMSAAMLVENAADRTEDGEYGVAIGRLIERERQAADAAKARLAPVWKRKAEPAVKRWRR